MRFWYRASEMLETELFSHAKIIIARRAKLRSLTRRRRACVRLSVLALFPGAHLCPLYLPRRQCLRHPTPVGSFQPTRHAAC